MSTVEKNKRGKRPRRLPLVPQKACLLCNGKMSGHDTHQVCVFCLGPDHALRAAAEGGEFCELCGMFDQKYLNRRRQRFVPKDDPMLARSTAIEREEDDMMSVQDDDDDLSSPARSWAEELDDVDPLTGTSQLLAATAAMEPGHKQPEPVLVVNYEQNSSSSAYSDSESEEENAGLPAAQAAAPPRGSQATHTATNSAGPQLADQDLLQDNAELHELFKRAALRTSVSWPEEEQLVKRTSKYDGIRGAGLTRTIKQVLPFDPDCLEAVQASWNNPLSFTAMPNIRHLDCAKMRENGTYHLPPVERGVAAHLLSASTPSSSSRGHSFPNKLNKDLSTYNKRAYDAVASTTRVLSAATLLQCSATELFKQAKNTPSKDTLAELRRLNDESLLLIRTATEAAGRAMAFMVIQERARWLERANISDSEKKEIMDEKISPDGLFGGAVATMLARWEEKKKEGEALKMCLPCKPSQPPPPPRRTYAQAAAPQQPFRAPARPTRGTSWDRRPAEQAGSRRPRQNRSDSRGRYPSASPARGGPPPQARRGGYNKQKKGE